MVKHYEYLLLDNNGKELALYGDSLQMITIEGMMTPFNELIGGADYQRNEDVKLFYKVKGFDTITNLVAKFVLWRINNDSLNTVDKGLIMYNWKPDSYSLSDTSNLNDTIKVSENRYKDYQTKDYFIIIETDTRKTDGLDKLLIESYIRFMHKNRVVEVSRKDTLYRKTNKEYQIRSH